MPYNMSMTQSNEFLTPRAAELACLSYVVVDSWDRSGLIKPSLRQSRGCGTGRERLWSYRDVLALRVVGALRAAGVTPQTLRRLIDALRLPGNLPRFVAINATELVATDNREEFMERMSSGFAWLVVDVERAERELRAEIARA